MGHEEDTNFSHLLSQLKILDEDSLQRASVVLLEKVKSGEHLSLAALLVQEGLLEYGMAEQLLAHQADTSILCKSCNTQMRASALDPRVPFRCVSCGHSVEVREPSSELSLIGTLGGDQGGDEKKSEEPDLSGRVLGGCKVLKKIGEGGMGVVYEGTHEFLKRKVAIKILPQHHVKQEGFVKRFLRESRSAAQLIHPNIVQVMDAGQEGDIHFIVMEFAEGQSLYEILKKEGRLRPFKALHYCRQAAMGLAAAAKNGIVHRDVKPDNIRAFPDGTAKVTDFGLAKAVEGAEKITRTGVVVGTPLYMSPEQARAEKVDLRGDIYSLGATLYHLMAGKPPFRGASVLEILSKHGKAPPAPLVGPNSAVPEEAEGLVFKMMAKKAEDRFQTYEDLLKAMEEAIGACKTVGTKKTVRIRGGAGGRQWIVIAIIVLGILAGVLGIWALV